MTTCRLTISSGMDTELEAGYERLRVRELAARHQTFREYPSFVATWVPGRAGKAVRPTAVRSWWRHDRVFAFRHDGHFYFPAFQFSSGAPKPLIRRLLLLIQPEDGWHAMFWFVGPNSWLYERAPVEMLDSCPNKVIEAAEHANDRISD